MALARALDLAAQAGEWGAVARLAGELEARRLARTGSNVVRLDPSKRKRDPRPGVLPGQPRSALRGPIHEHAGPAPVRRGDGHERAPGSGGGMIRIITTSPLTAEQQASVLAFIENDPNFSDCTVAFELGEAIEVDVPSDPGKHSELFGATLLTFVSYYFSGEGGAA